MVSVKKIVKNAGIYGVVQVLQGAIGFILLPVYTGYLTTSDYGIISVVTSITSFLSIFFLFGLNGAISKFYYHYVDDEALFKKFIGTIMTTILIISVVFSFFLFSTHTLILDKFIKGIDFYPYMAIGLLTIGFSTVFPIYQGILQMQHKAEKYAIQQLIMFTITIVLNIVLITVVKLGALGPLLSSFFVAVMTFVYTIIVFSKLINWKIEKKLMVKSLKYSMPLVPHSLAGWTSNLVDRVILNGLKNSSLVGIYNVGYQFGNIINMVSGAVNSAFVPWFFSIVKDKNNDKNQIYKFGNAFVLVYSLAALWLSILSPYLLKFMVNKNYYSAIDCIPYIAFAYVFNGIYYFFVSGLFYNEIGTKYIFLASTAGAVINIILNFVLIPKYEIIGASVATLLSYAFVSVLVLVISNFINKKDDIKWNFKTMYFMAVVAIALTYLIKKINGNIISDVALLLISTVVVHIASGLKLKELKIILKRK